ncbi:MAG: hypothetical protein C0436_03395 [Alphaproteobacteria bacterium]|nr:hypothetical protein [Alphaproteobacteria bacterium]
MQIGGFKTQIVVLCVLTLFGGVMLYNERLKGDASPYAVGSEVDILWRACKQGASDSRSFAVCSCPVDQLAKEAPVAACLHVAVTQQTEAARKASKPKPETFEVVNGVQGACKDKQTEESLTTYLRIVSDCDQRYVRHEGGV